MVSPDSIHFATPCRAGDNVLSVMVALTVAPPPRLPTHIMYPPGKKLQQSEFSKEWNRWCKYTQRAECLQYWEKLGWYYKYGKTGVWTGQPLTRGEKGELMDYIDDPQWRIRMKRMGFICVQEE